MDYSDILYEVREGVAVITINRPDVMNAFRDVTVRELIDAFQSSWADTAIGAVVLTGAGERAFCTGGDQTVRSESGYGGVRGQELGVGVDILGLHEAIRDIPKPVIAAVNGYAIGGGHVLHVLCDLTIASENAVFGQVGPRVGSYDAGYGSIALISAIGEKRAREMWYLCRRYTAQEALAMGLVNAVVPPDRLLGEAEAWCRDLLERSPFALATLKASFNAVTGWAKQFEQIAMGSLGLYYRTPEANEGRTAFREKRPPDFAPYRAGGPDPEGDHT